MPAPTPHTATRKIRSQSPPRATQRLPVIQMQAAMPARSMRPYMWIVIGPSSRVPEDGDGMEASSVTAERIVPRRADGARHKRLEQDLDGQVGRAAVPEQVDRVVEVDVAAAREQGGGGRLVAGALELLGTPSLHPLLFRLGGGLGRSHP